MTIIEAIKRLPELPCYKKVIAPPSAPRGDRLKNYNHKRFWKKLVKEANVLGIGKNKAIVTETASKHTNIPNGHYLIWVNTQGGETPGIASVPDDVMAELAKNTGIVIRKIINLGKKPIIYSLSGYTEKNNPYGLGPAAQTSELFHMHITAPPENTGEKTIELTGDNLIKFFSPINSLLEPFFKDVVDSIIKKFANQYSIETELIHQENTEELTPGLKIKIIGESSLTEYLMLMKILGNQFNEIYRSVMLGFEEMYCNFEKKADILNKLKEKLQSLGLEQNTVNQIIEFGKLFMPTLRQIQRWLKKEGLSEETKKNLNRINSKYLSFKNRLENNDIKEKIKIMFRLDDKQTEILLNFFRDMLISKEEQTEPKYTLSKNFSWRFLIDDYEINNNGELIIHSIKIYPSLISIGSNTMETYANIILQRET